MRYLMKQKWLTLADSFIIRDENENDIYQVIGKFLCIGAQLSFQDMAGNELMYIKQKIFAWGPTYELYKGDQLCAQVRKELFTLFSCRFTVDVPGPDDLTAKGDLLDHEYSFMQGETPVAHVSKQWFTWTDTYGIDIEAGVDDVLVLASAVVIDMACHEDRD
jgi:uncharacterized protein YxjI